MNDRRPDHKPIIAVSGSDEEARWGAWEDRATLVPSAYLAVIEVSGGVPVVVAPGADPEILAVRVDGLLLTGGADVDPRCYGADRHPQTQAADAARDGFEAALLEACSTRGVPVLAVCRGVQVLNVARGGTLVQHLPEAVGHEEHLRVPGVFSRHRVRVAPGTQLAGIVSSEHLDVPTHHHQAVDRVGRGLVATAWADDGVVEALEDRSHAFLVGVQWHPEVGDDLSLFRALVSAAARTP